VPDGRASGRCGAALTPGPELRQTKIAGDAALPLPGGPSALLELEGLRQTAALNQRVRVTMYDLPLRPLARIHLC
jgi:hypothetical protein